MPEIDHKEIGKKLDLFHLEGANPGMVFWHPKGALVYHIIVDDLRTELAKQGYQELKTPNVLGLETFKKSGHFDNYQDKMYFAGNKNQIEKKEPRWVMTPMNCPGQLEIYKTKMHSYKELPLKFSEMGSVYRYEQPGEINGLFRCREFTIDDAHIFALPEQVTNEVAELIDFITRYYQKFEFAIDHIEFSTRPKKSIGTPEQWSQAEEALKKALKKAKIDYKLNPGEGAFYGPKIDFHIKDKHGRTWQLGTIQVDMSMPERLGCFYIDDAGEKKYPVMIHRAILGSIERFIGILLEHFEGALPLWLSPTQAVIASISDKVADYAQEVYDKIKREDIRCQIDDRSESISKKIRDAEIQKIPYILVIGEKEKEAEKVAVRDRKGDQGQKDLNQFIKDISKIKSL
jgi:threonyl-tRNA synthetase